MERTDLNVSVDLPCGCRRVKYSLFEEMAWQILRRLPVVCPLHERAHQFSDDLFTQKLAVGWLACRIGLTGPIPLLICGELVTVETQLAN